jgi:lipopolysaccharide/colanic/teichoic acid biosynthesis glycosyltransferase
MSGLPLLEVAPPLMTRLDRATKRCIDVLGACLALLVSSPLWIPIAIGIKATSPGPVFFRQPRLGRGRQQFSIVKFRTLRMPTEEDEALKEEVSDDARPLHELRAKERLVEREVPFGRFLRRYGIDEIPQFMNVLRGEMSIVGPRPFIPSESETHDGWSARRFEVRPGITGLWQVSGRNELTGDELRQLDYLYVASWSLIWDLRIMAETPKVMVRGLGAY